MKLTEKLNKKVCNEFTFQRNKPKQQTQNEGYGKGILYNLQASYVKVYIFLTNNTDFLM